VISAMREARKLELKGWPSWQRDFPIVVWP
jgi:hypothetical protein